MIRSFKDKNTKALYDGKPVKKWKSFSRQAEKRLLTLDMATSLNDLRTYQATGSNL
jgi:plasmid maintenance system killer protein